jgi:selenide,water dikinase
VTTAVAYPVEALTTGPRIKLTSFSHGAGCACKLSLDTLGEVLALLGPQAAHDDVLVGLNEADDAAVIRLDDDESLILTLDFFTPLVDDAYTWGRIAAANAASDVYAMGGRPLVALNIVAWPREALPLELLGDVLRGGRDIATQGGFAIVGGHSVDDPEPKYGLVVVGRAPSDRIMTIDAARPGDVLVLTKPIGTGIVTTAIKQDAADEPVTDAAVRSMTTLNDTAASVLTAAGVRACTDVTGFGLCGHLHRVLRASGVAAEIDADAVPILPGALDLADRGFVPGGSKRNREAVEEHVRWTNASDLTRAVLCDAQTSGGLLAAVPADRVETVCAQLAGELASSVIGRVIEGPAGTISVRGDVLTTGDAPTVPRPARSE